MSNSIVGQGATISVSTDNGTTYTEISEINSCSGIGSGSATVIDTTHLKSTGKEKKLGLKDEGQVKLNMNFIDGDAGQGALSTARDNQTAVKIKVELDNSGGTNGTTWEFDSYVMNFETSGIGVDEKVTIDCTLEITGSVTKTEAA